MVKHSDWTVAFPTENGVRSKTDGKTVFSIFISSYYSVCLFICFKVISERKNIMWRESERSRLNKSYIWKTLSENLIIIIIINLIVMIMILYRLNLHNENNNKIFIWRWGFYYNENNYKSSFNNLINTRDTFLIELCLALKLYRQQQ